MDQYIEFITNHYLLCLALVVITYLLLHDLATNTFKKYQSISAMMAVTKMNTSDPLIIDVREVHEFIKGHIEDAINIPMGNLNDKLPSLQEHKSKPVIVTCQTGNISPSACKKLTNENFEQVLNLSGGMQSWEDSNLPIKSGRE